MIRRHGTPVTHAAKSLEEGVEDGARWFTGEPGDEADAARIALDDRWMKRRRGRHSEAPFG
jgi:hypothetical protein